MSELLITARTPRLGTGTGLRTYGVTAALARRAPVEVRYVEFGGAEPAPEYVQLPAVTLHGRGASRGAARASAYARALGGGVPPDLARGVSAELSRAGAGVTAATRIIADGPVAAAALLGLARSRPVVYLAHNLESGGFRGPAGQGALRRFERTVLRTFAESWMATRADERGARELAGEDVHTRYVPNVVDVAAIEPVTPLGARRLLFIADFSYAPNVEALRFLAGEVMPMVWSRDPEIRLLAAGRGLAQPPADPRIETPGFVAVLRDAYAACDAVLVPLLRGGGSPLKFAEGLAHGLPVVASAHAAALIEDGTPGEDFLVADGPAEFAIAIEALLGDPQRAAAIGLAGRRLAADHYSVDSLVTLLSAQCG